MTVQPSPVHAAAPEYHLKYSPASQREPARSASSPNGMAEYLLTCRKDRVSMNTARLTLRRCRSPSPPSGERVGVRGRSSQFKSIMQRIPRDLLQSTHLSSFSPTEIPLPKNASPNQAQSRLLKPIKDPPGGLSKTRLFLNETPSIECRKYLLLNCL
jgi:hypothetical protein